MKDISLSAIRRIMALRTPETIDLGLGELNLAPAAWMTGRAAAIASRGEWKYTPNAGLPELRDAVAEYAGAASEAQVCITAGAQEGLFAAVQAWVGPGDEVLVPDPGFLGYPTVVRMAGGTPKSYRLVPGQWGVDIEHLTSRITERTRMVILNTPSNPTGGVLRQNELELVLEIAQRHGMLVMIDEVYRELVLEGELPRLAPSHPRVIVIGGMSKSHAMTGLRLGWVCAGESLLDPVIVAHQYIATCASVFSQQLALEFLRAPENDGWLEHVRENLRSRREAAAAAWAEHVSTPVLEPAGAFYLFAPVPTCATEAFAMSLAREEKVLAIPGSAFGSEGEGWIRVSFAAEPAAIEQGIARIAAGIERTEG